MSIDDSKTAQVDNDVNIKICSRDRVIQLPINSTTSVRLALDTTELRVRAACGGLGTCGACLIQVIHGEFNPPSLAERQKLSPEDLEKGLRLACQLKALSCGELFLEHPAPGSDWKSLDVSHLYRINGNPAVIQHIYGLAIDLGTTHIRLSLWNRQSGRRIGSRYSINPQLSDGADVLTRLDNNRFSKKDSHRIGLAARSAIIDGVRDILSRDMGEITPILEQLGNVLIVGNTAMLTLICGSDGDQLYQPENWQKPIACLPIDVETWRNSWRTPHADINVVQPLAGFIGSDLLADLIATGVTEQFKPVLLADFGTNTEIALWDGQTLWATSVPGGPAFEGTGMRNGMTAESGAINKVSHEGEWHAHVLGMTSALGYCASGFIDAVALLLKQKNLKPSGRFAEPHPDGFRLESENPKSAIFANDIDIFQRAKASTAAAMAQLIAVSGLTMARLDTLWICGSFGQHLNLQHAIEVGLLPNLDSNRIKLLPNASLAGCEQLLLNPAAQSLLNNILERAKVINFGGVHEYENRFIENLRLQPMTI